MNSSEVGKETKVERKKIETERPVLEDPGLSRKPFYWAKKDGKVYRVDFRNPTRH